MADDPATGQSDTYESTTRMLLAVAAADKTSCQQLQQMNM